MSSSRRLRIRELLHLRPRQPSAPSSGDSSGPPSSPTSAVDNHPTEPLPVNSPPVPFQVGPELAHPEGLEILVEGINPTVDIVAVHGLNGHRSKTWTANNGTLWLRDLLPADIPNARIFSWGYNANTHATSQVSCQYLYGHARGLVSDLCRKRKLSNTMERPIIFVAHSLGGLVVKSALIHSDTARKGALEDHRSIKVSTYGIIFMGTPHHGGSGVELGKALVAVASLFVPADDRLLRHLERDSEWLQQQLGQYGPISNDFETKFAFETYKTPTLLGHSIMVVPPASAVVSGQANAEAIAINANHREMVRYPSRNDEGYITISEHLQVMANAAPEQTQNRWKIERSVDDVRNSDTKFTIPFSLPDVIEVEHFVARSEELAEIHHALKDAERSRRTAVVHGLGGMGKTQTATQYAKRHQDHYSAIFWMGAKDETSLKQSYAKAAVRISHEYPTALYVRDAVESGNLGQIVQACKKWFNQPGNSRWLIIYDNYDNPCFKLRGELDGLDNSPVVDDAPNETSKDYDIRPFLPETHHGAIIITTRSSRVTIGRRIQLRKLRQMEDSLDILAHASGRQNLAEDDDAIELAKELDGLPLALATAGAYLDNVATTWAEYLKMYRESWLRLQQTTPALLSYEDRALYSTWNMSYAQVQRLNPAAAMLLRVWAYFDNDDLWFELLRAVRRTPSRRWAPGYVRPIRRRHMKWIFTLTNDMLSFNEGLRILCDYGLVEANKATNESNGSESSGYSMHACVHSWMIHVLNEEGPNDLAWVSIHCVAQHVPNTNQPRYWEGNRRLLQHANRCYALTVADRVQVPDRAEWAWYKLGHLFEDQGRFNEAEFMLSRAVKGYEASPDRATSWLMMNSLYRLGGVLLDQGKSSNAETLLDRALQGCEACLGQEDENTISVISRLGALYERQNRLDDAEAMYKRGLEAAEKVSEPDDATVLVFRHNLGGLYATQDRHDDAELMLKHALQGREKSFGPDHVRTLKTVVNLGTLSLDRENLDDAEAMLQRALRGFEKALGAEHLDTLFVVRKIAILHEKQGNLPEAEEMYMRALQGFEAVLGVDGVKTYSLALAAMYNLANLYVWQGRCLEARGLFERCRDGYEVMHGVEHEEYLDAVERLENLEEFLRWAGL